MAKLQFRLRDKPLKIPSSLSPKRDCGPTVEDLKGTAFPSRGQISWKLCTVESILAVTTIKTTRFNNFREMGPGKSALVTTKKGLGISMVRRNKRQDLNRLETMFIGLSRGGLAMRTPVSYPKVGTAPIQQYYSLLVLFLPRGILPLQS